MENLTLGKIFGGRPEFLSSFKQAAVKEVPAAQSLLSQVDSIVVEGGFKNHLVEIFFDLDRCGWTWIELRFMANALMSACQDGGLDDRAGDNRLSSRL